MTKKYADIHAKVDPEAKAEAEEVLEKIGISMSDLINMTVRRVAYERRIPFSTSVTEDSFADITTREELEAYLDKLIEEDDGVRIPHDEVWAELKNRQKTKK